MPPTPNNSDLQSTTSDDISYIPDSTNSANAYIVTPPPPPPSYYQSSEPECGVECLLSLNDLATQDQMDDLNSQVTGMQISVDQNQLGNSQLLTSTDSLSAQIDDTTFDVLDQLNALADQIANVEPTVYRRNEYNYHYVTPNHQTVQGLEPTYEPDWNYEYYYNELNDPEAACNAVPTCGQCASYTGCVWCPGEQL